MSARGRREGRWIGATILVGIGVLGLAINFNLIPANFIDQLWKLWPVIPLLLGISLFMRRRHAFDEDRP